MDLLKEIYQFLFILIIRICQNDPRKTYFLLHRVNNSLDRVLETALIRVLQGRKVDLTAELIRYVGESGIDKYYLEADNGKGHLLEVPSDTSQDSLIVHFPLHVSLPPLTVLDDRGDLQ